MFLVLRRQDKKDIKVEQLEESSRRIKPEEEGKFVVLTFVGSKTYFKLIEDIVKNEPSVSEIGGMESLLTSLHVGFYSEDSGICDILNNHFEHYWVDKRVNKELNNPHYPEVESTFWKNINFKDEKCLPKECIPKEKSNQNKN